MLAETLALWGLGTIFLERHRRFTAGGIRARWLRARRLRLGRPCTRPEKALSTMTSTLPRTEGRSGTLGGERKGWVEQAALVTFIAVPFVAILAAIPVAWGGWLGWSDVLLSFVFYAVAGHGITVGFHRYLTHGSFKAKRPLRIGLTVAGSMAIEGPAVRWVADH